MTMNTLSGSGQNRLLAALPPAEQERLESMMMRVTLNQYDVICHPGDPISDVHFPIDAVVGMLRTFEDGSMVEVATIGNVGMIGLPLFFGVDEFSSDKVCQIPGAALTMRADDFRREVAHAGPLRAVVGRFAEAFTIQIAQISACNREHDIEQRAARWLLMNHDRAGRDAFPLTQEFLAHMLGVRREGVSAAASALQKAGLISYSRGQIVIRDRQGLEAASCECYRIIADAYRRLVG